MTRGGALRKSAEEAAHFSVDSVARGIGSHAIPVGVVGLGYVGLPLACHLAKHFRVLGFDIDASRVDELKSGADSTNEVDDPSLLAQETLSFGTDPKALADCGVIIVAVPTPVDLDMRPDLTPLVLASRTVGCHLRPGTTVVFESTVYPGATEEVCRAEIEKASGLVFNEGFFLGYSPERVNPGDRLHSIDKVVKVVSGSTPEILELLAWLYGSITRAGIHRAPSIAVAEASKITENIQRDVNIALINELAMVFDAIDVNIFDVLEAARTKWNFMSFYPGLVGGHCIGVDPYYLKHLAERLKVPAHLVTVSRAVNEGVPRFLAQRTIAAVLRNASHAAMPLQIGILGASFKENVPDVRNSKVVDLACELERMGCRVSVVDEQADEEAFSQEYGRRLVPFDELGRCHALVIAVRHQTFERSFSPSRLKAKLEPPYIVVDFKEMLNPEEALNCGLKLC